MLIVLSYDHQNALCDLLLHNLMTLKLRMVHRNEMNPRTDKINYFPLVLHDPPREQESPR